MVNNAQQENSSFNGWKWVILRRGGRGHDQSSENISNYLRIDVKIEQAASDCSIEPPIKVMFTF